MIQRVRAPISVDAVYDHKKRTFTPRAVVWEGRIYKVNKIGFHHTFREGRILYHVFSVTCPTIFFRIVCNTENLSWEVQEISDGEPD